LTGTKTIYNFDPCGQHHYQWHGDSTCQALKSEYVGKMGMTWPSFDVFLTWADINDNGGGVELGLLF
jgi:hypothetical protein